MSPTATDALPERDSLQRLEAAVSRGDAEQQLRAIHQCMTCFMMFQVLHEQMSESASTPPKLGEPPADRRFSEQESIAIHSLRSIVCVPLKDKEKDFAVIYVDHRIKMGQFSTTDVEFVAAFANQASTAIQNAQLFESVSAARNIGREWSRSGWGEA